MDNPSFIDDFTMFFQLKPPFIGDNCSYSIDCARDGETQNL